MVDPAQRNVADQRDDPDSLLNHYRSLIALRRELGEGFELLPSEDGILSYRRGEHVVTIDLAEHAATVFRREG
jgi:glycosidase